MPRLDRVEEAIARNQRTHIMNEPPIISIVIPVYNVEHWLRECLESVCAQTFADWECICVDDGSTDGSPALLDEYAAKDSRFRVIRREHSNAGTSRNAGLDLARGEFLSFLDSDDVFHPRMLETLAGTIESDEADIASCGRFEFEDGHFPALWPVPAKTKKRMVWRHPVDETDIFARWAGWAWDKLFRRSFVLENRLRFQEIPSSNDACFTYAALSLAGTVSSTQGAFVAHRKRDGSIEASRSDQSDCIAKAILAYRDLMITRGMFVLHSHLERDFKSWALHILFWHLDSINSLAGYEKLYSVIPGLAKTIGLDQLDGSKFEDSDDSPDRLAVILKGGTPVESIRFHERTLIKRIEKTNYYKRLALSWDYRLGNTILRIPRWLRHLARG